MKLKRNGSATGEFDIFTNTNSLFFKNIATNVVDLTIDGSGNSTFAGNVDIDGGTLNIKGSSASLINFADAADGNVGRIYYSHTDNYMAFKTNDLTRMNIDSSGAVLIGSEPKIDTATKLQVSGSDSGVSTIWSNADDVVIENDNSVGITLATPNTGNASIGFADPEAVNAGYVQYNHANNYLRFGTQATERLRIDSDGQVQIKGVGTTGADLILYNSDASIALNQMIGRLGFYKSDASGSGVGVSSSIQVRSDSSIGGKSFMSFHTDDGTLEQERMRIASSGAVFMYDIIGFSGTNSDMRYDSASGQVYYLTSSL